MHAQSVTDSLLAELKKATHDTVKIKTLISLSKQISISNDSTLNFIQESVKLADQLNSSEWVTKAHVGLGMWYLTTGKNPDTSIVIWHELYDRMKKENYLRGMAMAYRYIGKAYLFNASDSAILYNIKSIELFEALHDSDMVNSIKINLAVVYAQSGREEEGIALTKEAMLFADRTNNLPDAGTAATNVGYFYEWINNLDSAEVYFKKSGEYNSRRGDPVGIGHSIAKLGDIYFKKGQHEKAMKNYLEVQKTGREIKSDRLLNYSHNGFAEIALARKQWDEAIKNIHLTYQYSGKNKTEEMKYRESLYKAYFGKKDYEKALENYKMFIAVRDTFNNAERLQKVDALEAKFQNKEKQNKIELLNKENEIQHAAVQRQQFIRNSVIIFSLAAIFVGGLLFSRFKLKKQIESQQALLTERKRISAELHDDLGAQLSTARMFLNKLRTDGNGSEQKNIIESSLKILDGSINDLRKIMNDLQGSTLQDKGLIPAIEELVNRINELKQIRFSLSHHNLNSRLDKKSEHQLFRITQELINNTIKYASASRVGIDFTVRDGKVVLLYEDDGKGFVLDEVTRGRGLANIESRAGAAGGTVDFDTHPGNGFTATIEIPVIYASSKS